MHSKKGASEVITTVLMILLVIAAIAIIWAVISQFVTKGAKGVTNAGACITNQIEVTNAFSDPKYNYTYLRIKRTQGNDPATMVFYIGDSELTPNLAYEDQMGKLTGTIGEFNGNINAPLPNDNVGWWKINHTGWNTVMQKASVALKYGDQICQKSLPVEIKYCDLSNGGEQGACFWGPFN